MRTLERVPLGRTSLSVTRLGLGTAPLGGLYEPVAEAEAHDVVERARELGMRFFDTAPVYGYGLAERRLGHVLAQQPDDDVVVASKVGRLLRADAPVDVTQYHEGEPIFKGTPAVNPVFDFSYDGVMRSLEESLERMGIDRLDVVHIHDPDEHFTEALDGAYRALARLRDEGTIKAVSAGMNQAEMLAELARRADFDCFLLAGRYTLLDQSGLDELLPLAAERGIAIIAGGVFNSGILADPDHRPTYNYIPADVALVEKARRIRDVCAQHGVPLKAAAIQFAFGHPAVATVLVGCRSTDEVEENVRMYEWSIPGALWDDLRDQGLLPEEVPTP